MSDPARGHAEAVGILGGTFDPFHLGHLALARAARDELRLDRLLVIPAADPPHKPGRAISPAETRLRLVEAGIAGEPRMAASRIELDRPGPSYTVDTVAELLAHDGDAGRAREITVILSAESFAGLATWREPERLLDLARIAVAPRAGHPGPDMAAFEASGLRRVPAQARSRGMHISAPGIHPRRSAGAARSTEALRPTATSCRRPSPG